MHHDAYASPRLHLARGRNARPRARLPHLLALSRLAALRHVVCEIRGVQVIGTPKNCCALWKKGSGADDE